jgi:hypothetical protein
MNVLNGEKFPESISIDLKNIFYIDFLKISET